MTAKNWAISIGIDGYQFTSLPPLKYARKDAISISNFFKEDAKFNEVLLFTEDSPSFQGEPTIPYRSPLLRFFEKAFRDPFLSKDDSLWLFFSGHGIRYAGKDYLLPADGDPELAEQTGIDLDYISQKLNCSGAGYKFLIVDSCRIDGRKGEGFGSSEHEGITTFFSCKPYESSWEIGEPISQGAFTHTLLKIFRNQINKNSLTLKQAEKELQQETIALNREYGKPIQTPHISCESAGRAGVSLFPPSLSQSKLHIGKLINKNRTTPQKRSMKVRKGSRETLELKKNALDAEAAGQFKLAKDLWGQLFLLCPAEQDSYIKAIERIAEHLAVSDISLSISKSYNKPKNEENKTTILASQSNELDLNSSEAYIDNPEILESHSFDFESISLDINGQNIERRKGVGQYLTESIGSAKIQMVIIPGGSFTMGSQERKAVPRELPAHMVKVRPFLISKFPITKSQWREIAELPKIDIEILLRPCRRGGNNHPVVEISWYQSCEFCNRLTAKTGYEYRLPTEAEWEYACRARTTTPFHFGHAMNRDIANYNSNCANSVDHFPFANAFGLCDMHGNVWEWCQDYWHGTYKGAPSDGTPWLDSDANKNRVLRGGSWQNEPSLCRAAYRFFDNAHSCSKNVGFRIVRSI